MSDSSTSSPLRRLAGMLQPDRGDIIAVTLFAAAMGILLLATPVAVQALVNSVAQGGAIAPLIVVAGLLFLGLIFAGGIAAVQTWVVEILQRRLFARTVADLAARLPRVSMHVHDRTYAPEMVNRFFDVITIQKTGASLLLNGISLVLSILVGLIMLAFYHPLLLAFDILLLGIIALIVFSPLQRGVSTAIEESKAKYKVAEWLEELARHPHLFRAGGVSAWVFQASDSVVKDYLDKRSLHFRALFGQILSALLLHAVASTALLSIGGLLVMQGSLTLGQLVASELIVTLIVSSVAKMGKHLESFYDLVAATDKVGHLLDLPIEEDGTEPQPTAPTNAGAELELMEVTGMEPGAALPTEPLTCAIAPGSRVALHGPLGSGKRMLLEMIWGLRKPDSGWIRLDGRDLRGLALDSVRDDVHLVSEVEIMNATVRENVQIGRSSVSFDDVRDALRDTGILDEIERLPEGLDTRLTPNGRWLSSEAFRCLQIARAIAGKPRLILLSESILQLTGARKDAALATLFSPDANWTVIVATQSDELFELCDQVIELPEERTAPESSQELANQE